MILMAEVIEYIAENLKMAASN